MKPQAVISLIISAFLIAASCNDMPSGLEQKADHALEYGLSQLKQSVASVGDSTVFPRNDEPGKTWHTTNMHSWTSGFFPGCLWYAYEYSGDPFFRGAAERWTEALEPVKNQTNTHDLGFMIFCSYGNGYRLTGNETYRAVINHTAGTLANRYKRVTGVIRSWDWNKDVWQYPVIIDNMMNLELLFWSSKNGGPSEWYIVANEHAEKTAANHVRQDGSTYHVVDYNPDTGEVNERYTAQGFARDSCWARGQAWGIYGFTMTYRETGDRQFLKTARRLADYFIAHLPEDDPVPYWDFDASDIPDEPRDASAGAIAASGLLELSTCVAKEDEKSAEIYYNTAVKLLESLCSPVYLTEGTESPAILRHSVGSKPAGSEVDVALIYADYYFMEALLRYKRMTEN